MIENIETKIEAHVNSILQKDSIDFCDYQILVGELGRLKQKDKDAKWEADQEKRNEAMMAAFQNVINCGPKL